MQIGEVLIALVKVNNSKITVIWVNHPERFSSSNVIFSVFVICIFIGQLIFSSFGTYSKIDSPRQRKHLQLKLFETSNFYAFRINFSALCLIKKCPW